MAGAEDVVVRQVKQELRCKLCKHPGRAEIDHLLLQRSQRTMLADGTRVTGDYVVARLREMGVENPTHENLTTHWKRHCEVVDRNSEEEITAAVEGVLASMSPEQIGELSSGDALRVLRTQAFVELQARLKRTGKSGLSPDQLLRILEMEQKQKQSEDQARFLGVLGAGLKLAIDKRETPQLPTPAHPTLEAEVIREEEVVEA